MSIIAIAAGLGAAAILVTNFVSGWRGRDKRMRDLKRKRVQAPESAVVAKSLTHAKTTIGLSPQTEIPWKRSVRGSGQVEILYMDRSGKETRRIIVPHAVIGAERFGQGHPEQIAAYCKQAKAARTFNVAQISEITDQETGEISSADAWIAAHIKI